MPFLLDDNKVLTKRLISYTIKASTLDLGGFIVKKRILFSCFLVFMISLVCGISASAARRTDFPVTMVEQYSYSTAETVVNNFEITGVENLPGKYQNRLYYEYDGNGTASLELVCYNAQGMPLSTVYFSKYSDYIDVPDTTAMVELRAKNPAAHSDTYFHCKPINMYSVDGRAKAVYDLQEPIYNMVGWYSPVTVYADDGRSMDISPFLVDAYAQVGWYDLYTAGYRTIQRGYLTYKEVGDYQSIIDMVNEFLPFYEGTQYAASLYAIRTDAMDCWRNACGAPLGIVEYALGENSIGTPEVDITFTNVSYKEIVAFKLRFNCYNIFGQLEDTYHDYYYVDDAEQLPGETWTYSWTLYGADSVDKLSGMYITEAVFADGPKWLR